MREVKCDFVGGRSRGTYFFVVVFKYRENMTITRRNRWKRTSMSITVSLSLSPFFKDRRTSEENVLNFYVLHLSSFTVYPFLFLISVSKELVLHLHTIPLSLESDPAKLSSGLNILFFHWFLLFINILIYVEKKRGWLVSTEWKVEHRLPCGL